tara:strand:+ start:7316 stop:9154 length:1839 start_codon:yes stop_codon:yes gene_type:complete
MTRKSALSVDWESVNEDIINRLSILALNKLRTKKGLKPKTARDFIPDKHDVIRIFDSVTVTGCKEERGYVYLNLNGGDSWGYFHPASNAEIIYNFKDEPNYKTSEIDPAYYAEAKIRAELVKKQTKASAKLNEAAQSQASQRENFLQSVATKTKYYCLFRDESSDTYYVGYHDASNQSSHFHSVRSKQAGFDYLKQHGALAPEPVPTWNYHYDPSRVAFEFDKGFVNRFKPSIYMVNAKPALRMPPHIERLIRHVTGNEPAVFNHLINWLAFIFQKRRRTQTAWLLQGTTGTGKGLLINEVIQPLLGASNCATITLENLEDQFNAFTESTLLLFVDEVDTEQVKQQQKLVAKLKNWITEPARAVRGMRQEVRKVENFINIMMASNQHNSMRIESNDRRFNICPRQEQKLFPSGKNPAVFIQSLTLELQEFANYLSAYSIDENAVKTPLENAAKAQLKATTQTAGEEVAEALLAGDLNYFQTMQPMNSSVHTFFENHPINIGDMFEALMQQALRHQQSNQAHFLKHHDLFVFFEALVGSMPKTKAKLSKRLNHLGIHIQPHFIPVIGKTQRGVMINWKLLTVKNQATANTSPKKPAKPQKTKPSRNQLPKYKP